MTRGIRKLGFYNRSEEEIESDIKSKSRVCTICKERKPYSEFRKDKHQRDGRMSRCKACMVIVRAEKCKLRGVEETAKLERSYQVRRKYGITIREYETLLESQGGRCAICGSVDSRSTRTRHLFIDHSHSTGEVRGLLCHRCNIALGYMEESVHRMHSMITYISKYTNSSL